MDVLTNYILQNWALILILLAFVIMLRITVFLNRTTVIRMYALIIAVFLLSLIVFTEFYLGDIHKFKDARAIMTAIRYSATPIIIAIILFALLDKKYRWYVLIPSLLLAIINIVSIFTGIVFSINDDVELVRGVLGYLPYIGVGVYAAILVFVLFWQSNKQLTDIIPIAFIFFALFFGLTLPFIIGKEFSKIFCTTIAIALFVYYVFLILQLTKKDALTGLLNRQAYYAEIRENPKDITAFVSIDMNGLKVINDNHGHLAGDEALTTLANCFTKSTRIKQFVYRIGGDEFVIICHRTNEEELMKLVNDIKESVSKTKYSCSIGYSYAHNGDKTIDQMIKESDDMMYADKADYYSKEGKNRRHE